MYNFSDIIATWSLSEGPGSPRFATIGCIIESIEDFAKNATKEASEGKERIVELEGYVVGGFYLSVIS